MSALRKRVDRIDRRILALLQIDATLAVTEIAHRVHLSQRPCWSRPRRSVWG